MMSVYFYLKTFKLNKNSQTNFMNEEFYDYI